MGSKSATNGTCLYYRNVHPRLGTYGSVGHTTLRLNVDNLTNEKYSSSLWEIGYYGAPREYKLSFDYRF
ncbi:TonB-dependent receptor [Shewanella fodinae]|uniref:TonB-dependent receptor n=1 Tax=Shewanella fodinae TaxID=552357 RepID=UPI0010552CBB|nr:TonB-dependent receptor [Shewanella fodinae]